MTGFAKIRALHGTARRKQVSAALASLRSALRSLQRAGIAKPSPQGWRLTAIGKDAMAQFEVEEAWARTHKRRAAR